MSENLSYSAKSEVANLIKRRTRLERLKIALSKAPISAWFGMIVLFIYFFAAIFAPLIAPHGEAEIFPVAYAPWGDGHIFGTDTNRTLYSWNDSPSGYDSEGPSNQNYYMSYLLELTAQGESSPNGPSEIIFSEGFHLIEGSYTWEEARLDAIAKGGRLAKLDSAEKNNLAHNSLSEYFALYPDANVYIGAKEQGEGNWLWSDGEPLTYSNFRNCYISFT